MRDDDGRYIVIQKESGGGLGSFLVGALVGAGVALLLAPRSGEETQEELRARARLLRANAEDRVKDAQKSLEARLGDAREELKGRVDQVKDAVDAGRSAAEDYRAELQDRLDRSKAAYRAGVDAARHELVTAEGESGEGEEGGSQD